MSDLISRQAAIDALWKISHEHDSVYYTSAIYTAVDAIEELPSAQPYTEEQIQTMQDLEQAQLDKAYELGWKEGREALREETWEYVRDRFD